MLGATRQTGSGTHMIELLLVAAAAAKVPVVSCPLGFLLVTKRAPVGKALKPATCKPRQGLDKTRHSHTGAWQGMDRRHSRPCLS